MMIQFIFEMTAIKQFSCI